MIILIADSFLGENVWIHKISRQRKWFCPSRSLLASRVIDGIIDYSATSFQSPPARGKKLPHLFWPNFAAKQFSRSNFSASKIRLAVRVGLEKRLEGISELLNNIWWLPWFLQDKETYLKTYVTLSTSSLLALTPDKRALESRTVLVH